MSLTLRINLSTIQQFSGDSHISEWRIIHVFTWVSAPQLPLPRQTTRLVFPPDQQQPADERGFPNGVQYTVDEWCWEIPAGGVKNGQTIEAAAHQELLEEVGGTTSRPVEYLGRFFLANGICNETGHIFLASGVEVGTPQHEPAEIMSVHLVPVTEALRMARSGEITDGPTALALLLCAERLAALTTDEP